jgi:hypothetical protein
MNQTVETATPGRAGTAAAPERRRHPRQEVCAFVAIRCGDRVIEGYAENLSYCGVLVQSLTDLPEVGEYCDLTIELALGNVTAHGTVARVVPAERQFAVDIERVDENGHLLLVALVAPE